MRVPLFPLPNLVLFPGLILPLYVFEDRYRQLLADIQASGSPFGIVRIVEGSEESSLPFHERVAKVGTLAHLRQAQKHEDGTSTIAVVGGERFRVDTFDFTHPYLGADVTPWPLDPDPLAQAAEHELARQLLANLIRRHPEHAEALRTGAPSDPLLLASYAATFLPLSGAQREEVLCAPTLLDRLDQLLGQVPTDARLLN